MMKMRLSGNDAPGIVTGVQAPRSQLTEERRE